MPATRNPGAPRSFTGAGISSPRYSGIRSDQGPGTSGRTPLFMSGTEIDDGGKGGGAQRDAARRLDPEFSGGEIDEQRPVAWLGWHAMTAGLGCDDRRERT